MTSQGPNLSVENMNPCVKEMEYAVRGPLVIRATALQGEMEQVRLRILSITLYHNTIQAFLMHEGKLSLTAQHAAYINPTTFYNNSVLLPKTRETWESRAGSVVAERETETHRLPAAPQLLHLLDSPKGSKVRPVCGQYGPHQLLLHEDVPAVRAVQLHRPACAGRGPVPLHCLHCLPLRLGVQRQQYQRGRLGTLHAPTFQET